MTYTAASRLINNAGYVTTDTEEMYLLTGVSDNRGNALKINRMFIDDPNIEPVFSDFRGLIANVETVANGVNKQIATYSYSATHAQQNGYSMREVTLTSVDSTMNSRVDYWYKNYTHMGMYQDRLKTIPGVVVPLLSDYKKNGQSVMKWSADLNTLTSSSTGIFSSYISYAEGISKSQLTIRPPDVNATEIYTITNGYSNLPYINAPTPVNGSNARFVEYLTSSNLPCLSYNGVPLKRFAMDKTSRTLATVTDKNNNRTDFQYDIRNRLLEVTEAKGTTYQRKTTMTYLTNFDIPSTVKNAFQTLTKSINSLGQVLSETLTSTQAGSVNKITAYTFYANGLVNTIDGPRAGTIDKTTYSYDVFGNLEKESIQVGTVVRDTSYQNYDSFGNPGLITYPTGLVAKFIYNTDGTLQQKNYGSLNDVNINSGQKDLYTYDSFKRIKTHTNPDGEIATFNYDALDRVISTTNPDGSQVVKSYFGNGILQSSELWDAAKTQVFDATYQALDANGRIGSVRRGVNTAKNTDTKTYDANGNLLSIVTKQGITESWTYDALNRISTHTDSNGKIDKKTYDTLNNIKSALDAVNSGSAPLDYINGSVLRRDVNNDFGTKVYNYNETDQLTQTLQGSRQCDFYNIDALGRSERSVCQSATGVTPVNLRSDYSFVYDSSQFGRLDRVMPNDTQYGVNNLYRYDTYDRVTQLTQVNQATALINGGTSSITAMYYYTTNGKMLSLSKSVGPSMHSVDYQYDDKGRLKSINFLGQPVVSNIIYNGGGQIYSWNWGSTAAQAIVGYDPDKNGLLKSMVYKNPSGGMLYGVSADFDNDGRVIALNRYNAVNDTYGYDNEGRLTNESRKSGTTAVYGISYTYDDNGNRKTLTATGTHQQPYANVQYTYLPNTNRLASVINNGISKSGSYTEAGELGFSDFNESYDSAGRKRIINQVADQTAYINSYNYKNQRTLRLSQKNGVIDAASTIQYLYDESGHLLGDYDSKGFLLAEYIWMGDRPVATFVPGSGIYWIATDLQGTPRRLFKSDDFSVAWAWDSTAFGVGDPSVQTVKFNLRFPGQYYDELTKQHYNMNRYYSPVLGRYLEPDPIGLEGGLNPYAYAGSNPVMNIDSSGLEVVGTFSGNTAAFTDKNLFIPGLKTRNVSPSEYRFDMTMPYNQVMVFNNVFSGENRTEDFKRHFDYMTKPTPAGKYEILENIFSKHGDWYRLDPIDSVPRDDLWNSMGIGQIRLHRGLISHACVTFDQRFNSKYDWDKLKMLFDSTSSTQVPVTGVIKQYGGLKSNELHGTATRFGTFYVK